MCHLESLLCKNFAHYLIKLYIYMKIIRLTILYLLRQNILFYFINMYYTLNFYLSTFHLKYSHEKYKGATNGAQEKKSCQLRRFTVVSP